MIQIMLLQQNDCVKAGDHWRESLMGSDPKWQPVPDEWVDRTPEKIECSIWGCFSNKIEIVRGWIPDAHRRHGG